MVYGSRAIHFQSEFYCTAFPDHRLKHIDANEYRSTCLVANYVIPATHSYAPDQSPKKITYLGILSDNLYAREVMLIHPKAYPRMLINVLKMSIEDWLNIDYIGGDSVEITA